jgi:hypothetical protein
MCAFILECFEKGPPTTYEVIAHFLESEMSKCILLDTLRHLLGHHLWSRTVVGIPIERERAELDLREIGEFYDRLRGEMSGIPSAMFYNLDETGHQDWPDRKDICVVVPASYEHDSIYVACDRSSK